MPTGCVNRILSASAVDGPGNRFAVFLQGCNLRCGYCHNPETWQACTGCGRCVAACRSGALRRAGSTVVHDPARCRSCGRCLTRCRRHSSPRTCVITSAAVADLLAENRPFISGLTVSGGEASQQPAFTAAICRAARRLRLTAFIDTNGMMPPAVCRQLLAAASAFMVDLKAFRPADHQLLTGTADNAPVLATIRAAARARKLYEVRTVVVDGLFDNRRNIRLAAAFLAALPHPPRFTLIAFRRAGVRGPARRWREPQPALMRELAAIAAAAGLRRVSVI